MTNSAARPGLTLSQWLVCGVAALGFAFDIYELLMLPLIVRPALMELTGARPGSPEFNYWVGMLFYVPAMAGGVFGLLGGYLTDRLGRRRVLTWSILIYAGSAFAAGFATDITTLLILRCLTFVGVCVEFVAAVAWLAELFPEPRRRESVIGWTQAFSSMGGIMVAGAYYLAVTWGSSLPEVRGGHEAWRYTLMSGLIPAIPLIVIRPFLPESPTWAEKKRAGTLRRPALASLFAPALRRTTVVTTIMFACSYGAAFGAIQHIPRIVPGLEEVRPLPRPAQEQVISVVQTWQEVGGLTGRALLALLAVRIVSRRLLLRVFQVPGLAILPLVFVLAPGSSLDFVKWGIFLCGVMTVAQFSFWGNYLPRVYPTYLRGTGEGFAANVGGRMIGTSAALVTTQLANVMPGGTPAVTLAYAAASVGAAVYVVGLIASFWLPEPRTEALPD
jgi:MFS family permease